MTPRLRFNSLLLIFALVASACGAVPASDWCYTFNLPQGSVSSVPGWAGSTTGQNFVLEFSRSSFTPTHIQIFVSNSGAADNVYFDAEGWGAVLGQSVTIPSGNSSAWVAAGSAGSAGYLSVEGAIPEISISAVRFYGNGSNPFPSNECAAAPTATPAPSASATPAAVGLAVDVGMFFTSTNGWIDALLPVLAIGLGIAIALAILAYVGGIILDAVRRQ